MKNYLYFYTLNSADGFYKIDDKIMHGPVAGLNRIVWHYKLIHFDKGSCEAFEVCHDSVTQIEDILNNWFGGLIDQEIPYDFLFECIFKNLGFVRKVDCQDECFNVEKSNQNIQFIYIDESSKYLDILNKILSQLVNKAKDLDQKWDYHELLEIKYDQSTKVIELNEPLVCLSNRSVLNVVLVPRNISYRSLICCDKLGRGMVSVVHKGIWRNKIVAIKKLFYERKYQYPMSVVEKNFLQEFGVMSKLTHPNIVSLYGFCRDEKRKAIVMEYCPGGSLKDFFKKKSPLIWPKRLEIAKAIGSVLLYLHNQNIIYRDLKATNVMFDGNMQIKLIDFGSAKFDGFDGFFTLTGGSYKWMAPESISRFRSYTKMSDVYSYGVMLWSLAAWREPFPDIKYNEKTTLVHRVFKGDREKIPEDAPPSYAALIARCWDKRAESRPNMQDAIQALDGIQKKLDYEIKSIENS